MLLMSVFGGKIAFAYVIVGLIVAVAGGTLIEKLHMEDQVEEFIRQAQNVDIESPKLTVGDRMNYAKNQVVSTVKKVAPYIFVGVAIGADNSQSDSGAYSSKHIRRTEVVCGAAGDGGRSPDVCR